MVNFTLIIFGKLISKISQLLNLGSGSTWPGHVILTLSPKFLKQFRKKFKGKIILIAGTNGKTTTSKILGIITKQAGKKIIYNQAGANLLNGLASALIQQANLAGRVNSDLIIFEIDENTLPEAARQLKPDFLVLLNLFRDQLDRYGEVDAIAQKWQKSLLMLPQKSQLILNADDPCLVSLGKNLKNPVFWFGIEDKKLYLGKQPHTMDVIYCPNCQERLVFDGIYFAHLGKWYCPFCGFTRPKISYQKQKPPIPGIYNLYNTYAAVLVAQKLGINEKAIKKGLANFIPAFGRQEEFKVDSLPAGRQGKKVKIFLSKNPTGFNESIRTVKDLGGKNFLLVLNDRIPDGRDVSWIWDVDTEELLENVKSVIISGDRAYDLGLRIKYSGSSEFLISNFQFSLKIETNLKRAITLGLKQTAKTETLYVLPTYSAMLEIRKILTGKKIL